MKKVFLLSLFFCISCMPYYQYDPYYNNNNHGYMPNCVKNPFMYHIDPMGWQQWERLNYNVSCTKLESERRYNSW